MAKFDPFRIGEPTDDEKARRAVDLGNVSGALQDCVAVLVGHNLDGTAETIEHVIDEIEGEMGRDESEG